jgi:hypothetical protein
MLVSMKSATYCDAMVCSLLMVYGSTDESTDSNFRVKGQRGQANKKQRAAEAGDNPFFRNVDTSTSTQNVTS